MPSQLWTMGSDTKPELIEHLLREHNTVGFTRAELNGMTREQLVGLHSAAHQGLVRRR